MTENINTHHFASLRTIQIMNLARAILTKTMEFKNKNYLLYTIALLVMNLFLNCTALIGNLLMLLAIWKTSSLHKAADMLLANFAVSDLAVSLAGHPLFVAAGC